MPPFIVFALPRSRTAWLSRFLSYGPWHCGHDETRHLRGLDDIASWFSQPFTGTSETAAAPFWRTVEKHAPDARVVVVRRPVGESLDSLMNLGIAFDRGRLSEELVRHDRKLDQIERRMGNVLSVSFASLEQEDTCRKVFEHALQQPHDPAWWAYTASLNVQVNLPGMMRYMGAHMPQLRRVAAQVKVQTLTDMSRGAFREPDDLVIRTEPLADFYRDGQRIFAEHAARVGESPEGVPGKNWDMYRSLEKYNELQITTARCNGKMFGYLVTVLSPSLDIPGREEAMHTLYYASPEFPGLGRKLQHAARKFLEDRGVGDLILRAGTRGDGPRLAALYRRMGAEDNGQLFRLKLKEV